MAQAEKVERQTRGVYIASHYISQETYGDQETQTGCVGAERNHEKVAVIGEDSTYRGFFICKNQVGKQTMRDAFSDCHPVVNFIFYIGALVMGMCFIHPLFLACSVVLSLAYYVTLKHRCVKYLAGMAALFVAITVINPLFNPEHVGEHVLFTYFGDKPYMLESLCYGAAIAAMLVTIITWFATYNRVMTGDKFLYCFGRLAPSVSLILTMVLRLLPSFQKKAQQIGGARKCIGKSVGNGTAYEKAAHGLTLVSVLTSWALEGGVVMADSMRSRGFGSGKRTSFSLYRMKKTDWLLLVLMLGYIGVMIVCACSGGMQVEYMPRIQIARLDTVWTILGGVCYCLFLSIPVLMHILEEITWRILRSKM